jgi:hypothetical protein
MPPGRDVDGARYRELLVENTRPAFEALEPREKLTGLCPLCGRDATPTHGYLLTRCHGDGLHDSTMLRRMAPMGESCVVVVDSDPDNWDGLDINDQRRVIRDNLDVLDDVARWSERPRFTFLKDMYYPPAVDVLYVDGVPSCPGCRERIEPMGSHNGTEDHHWDYYNNVLTKFCKTCHRDRLHRRGRVRELRRIASRESGYDSWVDVAVESLASTTARAGEPGWLGTLGLPGDYEPSTRVCLSVDRQYRPGLREFL